MNEELIEDRRVIIKRHRKHKCDLRQNAFLNLNSIGNCTVCKLSIALLIAASFIIVKPQPQNSYKKNVPQDSLISSKTDTVHIVAPARIVPSGIITLNQ